MAWKENNGHGAWQNFFLNIKHLLTIHKFYLLPCPDWGGILKETNIFFQFTSQFKPTKRKWKMGQNCSIFLQPDFEWIFLYANIYLVKYITEYGIDVSIILNCKSLFMFIFPRRCNNNGWSKENCINLYEKGS